MCARARVRALGASPARRGEVAALRRALGTRSGPARAAAAAAEAATILLPELRAVADTPAGARRPARLLHVVPPLADASSLHLPPSPAPPSALAPDANPATDDQLPPLPSAPGTRCLGSVIPTGAATGYLGLPPSPGFSSTRTFSRWVGGHLAPCNRPSPLPFCTLCSRATPHFAPEWLPRPLYYVLHPFPRVSVTCIPALLCIPFSASRYLSCLPFSPLFLSRREVLELPSERTFCCHQITSRSCPGGEIYKFSLNHVFAFNKVTC